MTLTTAPRRLLTRLLDQPNLVDKVRALPPDALLRLVGEVGLEDAGELIALATVEQLQQMFDEDLWRSARAGEDERFDAARFSLWLEVLLEAGEAFAADRLAQLPEELLAHALGEQLLVIDLDALALGDVDAQLEKALESTLHLEIDQYRLVARRHEGWDALTALLLALDERHPDLLRRLFERLAFSDDVDALHHALTADETVAADAAAEREDRRARVGFVSPSSAKAFLLLRDDSPARDPLTRAYFRELQPAPPETPRSLDLMALVDEQRPRALLADPSPSPFRRALFQLEGAAREERLRELVYLANVLVAGATVEKRRFRPAEAAEAALAVCNLGFELVGKVTSCDHLFRVGWKRLHQDAPRAAPNEYPQRE